jgi:hypothetical protein
MNNNTIYINQRDSANNDQAVMQQHAALDSVKHIRLFKCDRITVLGFTALIASKADSLERLEIINCKNINAAAFINVRTLHKLKHLTINGCMLQNEALWNICCSCTKIIHLDVRNTDVDQFGFLYVNRLDAYDEESLTIRTSASCMRINGGKVY